ncbi:MAG TPA: SDR family oxidoreductase [Caulobacterales bacterium]|nr:SDR family oxidoreductase [Caulobacterales bacterium]
MSWALVTGAAHRLGRAVALDLAQAGWSVAIHHHNSADAAEAVAAEARRRGVRAATLRADLADTNAAADLIAAATQIAPAAELRALVNCAAIFEHDAIASLQEDRFFRHMELNALAPSLLARDYAAVLPDDAHGAVVNFLDFKLANPYPDHFSYTLSKYALAGATDLLARALAPKVRVNAVAPGYVLPAPGQADADYARLHDDTPLNRGPNPEDIAHAVRFLIENPAVTGQTVFVDGGRRFRSYDRDMAFM